MKFSLIAAFVPLATAAFPAGWVANPTEGQVWVDTRGGGHVQMGYLSANNEDNYPVVISSGQPGVTSESCVKACDNLGPSICGAAQIFLCKDESVTWCNLLTPAEFASSTPVVVNDAEVVGLSFSRSSSKPKPKPSPATLRG